MQVSRFYLNACKDKAFYKSLQGNQYGQVVNQAIHTMCNELYKGRPHSAILRMLREEFVSSVKDEWFSFSWQKKTEISDQIMKFERFFKWLGTIKVLDCNVDVSIPFKSDGLQSKVALIVQYENGAFGAVNIFRGKSKKSMSGRNVHTCMKTDLHALCAKKVLETRYPGIIVSNVYLTNENDSLGNVLPEFETSGKRSSNVYSLNFKEYYEKGVFQHQKMLDTILSIVKTPLQPSCYGCIHERLCKTSAPMPVCSGDRQKEEAKYNLPKFTVTQKEVVAHKSGPCLVLAGPGSGKTATLTGRIKYLIHSGVEPEFILAITFTREAANEIEERVSSFTEELPYISTIHALCYDILKKNASKVGTKVKLLGNKERLSVIENMAEAFEPLQGFNYNLVEGQQGLLKTLERKLDKFFLTFHSNAEVFLSEEKELGYDFIQFAKYYENLCKSKGYISFSQQISLCIQLFKEHPEVLSAYSSIFKYIMVDEFQDVDAMQAEFIYLLAGHKNLLVVGDDDQSIYGFRGGSHRYMLEFQKKFPAAKVFRLRENFRSTESLVNSAQAVIGANTERLGKEMVSGRQKKGIGPVLVPEKTAERIDIILQEVLKQYEPKNIAVLSVKNATLEELSKQMKVPHVIDKQLLINDIFFGLLHDCLSLYQTRMADAYSFCHYLKLFGICNKKIKDVINTSYFDILDESYESLRKNDAVHTALRLLHFAFRTLEEEPVSPAFFIQFFAYSSNLEDSPSYPVISGMAEEQNLNTIEELEALLKNMVHLQDDTRLDVSSINAVHLITNHESKGREFQVVILVDDFKAELTEELRRLYYVAMTRAKDLLYICYDAEKPSVTQQIMEVSND